MTGIANKVTQENIKNIKRAEIERQLERQAGRQAGGRAGGRAGGHSFIISLHINELQTGMGTPTSIAKTKCRKFGGTI